MERPTKNTLLASIIAGTVAFLLMIADLLAFRIKSPLAGTIENWLLIVLEILAIVFISRYHFAKAPNPPADGKTVFGVGLYISIFFSLTLALLSFLFIELIYPGYEVEMFWFLYNPSPFASAAETVGGFLGAQTASNAYSGSLSRLVLGVVFGLIISITTAFCRKYIYRNLTRAST